MSKTRLIEAVKTLDLKETKRILEAKPELLKVWNDQGRNLLHLACGANPKKLHKPESAGAKFVTFLLDQGLDIEEEGGSGSDLCKPIWFATAFGRNATVVKLLIKRGQLPVQAARKDPYFLKIQVEVRATFRHAQIEKVIDQDGNRRVIEVPDGKSDQRSVFDFLHAPRMGNEMK